jgi:hypothetical protein
VRAGGTFENQGFLYEALGGRAGFKGSNSGGEKWRDYMRDKGEERKHLGRRAVSEKAGDRRKGC